MADYVLIDTPPCCWSRMRSFLHKHVDALILTARLGATTRDEAEEVRTLLERAGVRVIGVVAGGVRTRRRYYYTSAVTDTDYGYRESTSPRASSRRTVSSSAK